VTSATEAVDWLAASPPVTALFTDFDGTLSPIVARPEIAAPLPGVPEVLKALAYRLHVVAVVSGRPATWLVEQLGLTPAAPPVSAVRGAPGGVVEAYGLHGLEHTRGGPIELAEGATAWQEAAAAARDAARAAAVPEVEIEDKLYGVTLHWRGAADQQAVSEQATRLGERLAASTGLLQRAGKASLELVAPIGIDKGSVVRAWGHTAGVERLAFFGDDVSDLSAFDAIDELTTSGEIAGLKVAVTGHEAPEELLNRADLILDAPEAALQLLIELAERLEVGSGAR
jgi:trehalose 6-phosphate phosphatase